MTDTMICSVYRSAKKEGMYLYVPKATLFESVPEVLMKQFGTPGHVMDMLLTQDKKLARVNAQEVLLGLNDQGFFLQMPPGKDLLPY